MEIGVRAVKHRECKARWTSGGDNKRYDGRDGVNQRGSLYKNTIKFTNGNQINYILIHLHILNSSSQQ